MSPNFSDLEHNKKNLIASAQNKIRLDLLSQNKLSSLQNS